jgi:hypothetical protein
MDIYQAARQTDKLQRIADNLKKQGASEEKIRSVINIFLDETKRKILARENTLD